MSRDIRQGDPISPYLFVLYIEWLAHGIELAMEMKLWKTMRINKHNPPISHFFFTNDLMLLAETSIEQVNVINECLDKFYATLGEKINSNKKHIIVTKNKNHVIMAEIVKAGGFKVTTNLGKNLGTLIRHS